MGHLESLTPAQDRSDRYFWADAARTIACIQVIGVHAFSPILGLNGDLLSRSILQILIVSFMSCVPIFAMLTGSLILGKDRIPTVWVYTIKKPLKIIFITIFWEIAFSFLVNRILSDGKFNIFSTLDNLSTGKIENFTLWYMYQLVGLYMLIPFVFLMLKNSSTRTNILFSLIGVTFACVPIFINKTLGVRYWIPFPQNFFSLWPAYMMAGYILVVNSDYLKRNLYTIIFIYIISIIISAILNIIFIPRGIIFHQYEDPIMIAMSLSFFTILIILSDKTKIIPGFITLTRVISPISFGLYLVHYLVLKIIIYYVPSSGIMIALLHTLLTFVVSAVIAIGIARVPILRGLTTV